MLTNPLPSGRQKRCTAGVRSTMRWVRVSRVSSVVCMPWIVPDRLPPGRTLYDWSERATERPDTRSAGMRTIQTRGTVSPKGKLTVALPPDVAPGEHQVVIVLDDVP